MKGFHPFIQMRIVAVTEMKGPAPLFPDFILVSSPGDASGLENSVHRKGLTYFLRDHEMPIMRSVLRYGVRCGMRKGQVLA